MPRALKLDAAAHGNVRVGVVIVHTGTGADAVHGIEQVVEELLVAAVVVLVVVLVDDGNDEGDVGGGHQLIVTIIVGVMTSATLEVLGVYRKRGEADARHGRVDLIDGGSAVMYKNDIINEEEGRQRIG